MKRLIIITLLLIVGIASVPFLAPRKPLSSGTEEEHPQIQIVRIHFSDTSIFAETIGLRQGTAKRQRNPIRAGNIFFEHRDNTGELLTSGTIADPRIVYYDTPIDKSGKLQGGQVTLPQGDFDIRLTPATTPSVLVLTDYTQDSKGIEILRHEIPLQR